MKIADEEIRQRNFDRYDSWGRFWIELANHSLTDISSNFITVATILLPVTASIFAIDVTITIGMRHQIFVVWFLLILSMISGITQSFIDTLYFRDLSRDNIGRALIWSVTDFTNEEMRRLDRNRPSKKSSGSHIAVYLQAVTLLIAVLLILSLGYQVLFNYYQ